LDGGDPAEDRPEGRSAASSLVPFSRSRESPSLDLTVSLLPIPGSPSSGCLEIVLDLESAPGAILSDTVELESPLSGDAPAAGVCRPAPRRRGVRAGGWRASGPATGRVPGSVRRKPRPPAPARRCLGRGERGRQSRKFSHRLRSLAGRRHLTPGFRPCRSGGFGPPARFLPLAAGPALPSAGPPPPSAVPPQIMAVGTAYGPAAAESAPTGVIRHGLPESASATPSEVRVPDSPHGGPPVSSGGMSRLPRFRFPRPVSPDFGGHREPRTVRRPPPPCRAIPIGLEAPGDPGRHVSPGRRARLRNARTGRLDPPHPEPASGPASSRILIAEPWISRPGSERPDRLGAWRSPVSARTVAEGGGRGSFRAFSWGRRSLPEASANDGRRPSEVPRGGPLSRSAPVGPFLPVLFPVGGEVPADIREGSERA
jgi:hypothetical protein